MIIIIDTGIGAKEISNFLRVPNKIVSPGKVVPANAYILSDGDMKNQKHIEKILKEVDNPVLGIGASALMIAAAFDAKIKKVAKKEGPERLSLRKPCPLTLDLKRMFSVYESYTNVIDELPENFGIIASSKSYEYEIVQEMENPFFGVQFNPEKGFDGRKIIDNFVKFVEVWEKYHK